MILLGSAMLVMAMCLVWRIMDDMPGIDLGRWMQASTTWWTGILFILAGLLLWSLRRIGQ